MPEKKVLCAIILTMLALGLTSLVFSVHAAKAEGLVGDLNGDGKVDIKDLYKACEAFGCTSGDPMWNANADIDGNGRMDLLDIYALASHFGQGSP